MTETKITTNEINQTVDLQVAGNTVITSNVPLTGSTADGFAATPTAIWNVDGSTAGTGVYNGTKVGAYDLTVNVDGLTASLDCLGVSHHNTFSGNNYLTNTSADLNFSNLFSIGLKMLLPTWVPVGAQIIWSNSETDSGVVLYLDGNGNLLYKENEAVLITYSPAGLDPTAYHTFAIWRTATTVYLFIDGICVGSTARGTITAKSLFQISGVNGANALLPLGARVDEIWVDLVNTPTADTLRNIYARSAKKFAVKDQANNVSVFPTPTLASGVYTPTYTAVGGGNVSGCTPTQALWSRVGNIVTVSGGLSIVPTGAGDSYLQLTVPIETTMTSDYDARGTIGTENATSSESGSVYCESGSVPTQVRINVRLNASNTGAGYIYQYVVK